MGVGLEQNRLTGVARARWLLGLVGRRGSKRNVRKRIMAVEMMLLSRNRRRLSLSVSMDDRTGVRIGLMVRTVAAGETAVGLGLLVIYYRVHGTVGRDDRNRRQA